MLMKSVKKVLALVIVFILMAASFAACGRMSGDADRNADEEVTATPTGEPDQTPEATPEATDEASPEPTETPEATQEETPAPSPESTGEAQSGADGTKVNSDEVLGSVNGNTYTNEYFGFSIEIPDGWFVASQEQMAQIFQLTSDYLKNSSDIDLMQQKLIPLLFTASGDPFTNAAGSGPSINIIAENISATKSLIPDAQTYLNVAQVSMKQQVQGMEITFGDIETLTIDGQDVAKVAMTTTPAEGSETKQTMYAVLKGDYVLVFTASFESEELDNAMNTLSFKN